MKIEALRDWFAALITGYSFAYNAWVEAEGDALRRYCVLLSDGGAPTEVDLRRQRYRVMLLGKRNEPGDAKKLLQDADLIIEASINEDVPPPCGVVRIRSMGEASSVGFTTEGRAWCQLVFEITF